MTSPGGPRRSGPGSSSGPGGRPRGRGRRFFPPRRRVCAFCVDHVQVIDYKDGAKLRRYLSERARIEGRRRSGTCATHQRALAIAIKRARHLALLPYVSKLEREPAPREWHGRGEGPPRERMAPVAVPRTQEAIIPPAPQPAREEPPKEGLPAG